MLSFDLISLFILVTLSTSISSSSIHIDQLPSDAQALLDFKSKADLHNLLPFNSSTSHCTWPGVQCASPNHPRIFRFVINNLPLAGFLPPSTLSRLDQLRVLSLQNNSLSGPIPDLSGLLNLKSLFLDHNSFSGDFPPSISSLHRLRTLDLSSNNLTGPIPALNQPTLLRFNVSSNNLSGAIPTTSVLAKFAPSSFSSNPSLCGEIVHRECRRRRQNSAIAILEFLGFTIGVVVLIATAATLAIRKQRRKRREREMNRSALIEGGGAEEAVAEVMRTEEEREEKVKTVEEGIKAVKSGSLMFFAGEAQPYTVDELMRASAERLGRGKVGTTYKVALDKDWTVCVKRLDGRKRKVVAGAGRDVFARHMGLLAGLRHPNLVPLRAYFHFQDKDESLLVYDYQSNGSLFSLIHGSKSARAKPLHWTSCLKIAEDVAKGLSYIHQSCKYPHGNLKSSNVLLGTDFEARLTDYCLTILYENESDLDDESEYLAPEIHVSAHEATRKSDVYAFGVLLLELLTGKSPLQHPYLGPREMGRWMRNTREDVMEEERRLEMLLEVGLSCRVKAQEKRPTMCQVLRMLQEIKEAVFVEDSDLDI